MGKMKIGELLLFYLSEHPTIVGFRWSPSQSWGSTWSFLVTSVFLYVASSAVLHLLLPRRWRVPLGPIPAAHSLVMAVLSSTIFVGILVSSAAEIRHTRWFWRGRAQTTPFQWLLCFPLGTRPSGRVFFWSYVFYVSRFLLPLKTLFAVLRRRTLPGHHLINHSFVIFMSFLWLEFSQSFQVLAIVSTTLVSSVVYGYRFWTAVGLPGACFPIVVTCQVVLLGCNLVCHVGVLMMHLIKGGCNGIGAWGFNSVLNAAILIVFVKFYVKNYRKRKHTAGKVAGEVVGGLDRTRECRNVASESQGFGTDDGGAGD